jgi:hypothetical protein
VVCCGDDGAMAEPFDDTSIIMEALFDIRSNTELIIDLLEEDNGEEEETNS